MSTDAPRNPDGYTEDELWQQLEGQVGSERASTLFDLGQMAYNRDEFPNALSLVDSSLEAARESDNEQMVARILVLRGFSLFMLDREAEAAEDFLAAAKIYEEYDSLSDLTKTYVAAARAFRYSGELEKALEYADAAVRVAEQTEESFDIGECYSFRAEVLQRMGADDKEVLASLSIARTEFRKIELADRVLDIDADAASVLERMQDYDGAINILRDCQLVSEAYGEDRAVYFSYRLSPVLRYAGRVDDALIEAQRVVDYNTKTQETVKLAHGLVELAECYRDKREASAAFDALKRARAHFEYNGKDGHVTDCDAKRAAWLFSLGRYEEAIEVNQLLLETTTGMANLLARARLADNLLRVQRFEEAADVTVEDGESIEFEGTQDWFWFRSIYSTALAEMGNLPGAWSEAERCLGMQRDMRDGTRARFLEYLSQKAQADQNEELRLELLVESLAYYSTGERHRDAARVAREVLSLMFHPAEEESATEGS